MGVYIKGMEMPKSCLSCPLQGGTADCRLTQKTYNWCLPERPSDCPLVPVPKHGRMIDADALLFGCERIEGKYATREYAFSQSAIEKAPTIIPAEEGE